MWIGGLRVWSAIRLGSTPGAGDVAPEGAADALPSRSSSIDHGRRRHAEPTIMRKVQPKTWALARTRFGRVGEVDYTLFPQAGAWTTREGPPTHQPVNRGSSADDQQRRGYRVTIERGAINW